jgi:hypothetical protein
MAGDALRVAFLTRWIVRGHNPLQSRKQQAGATVFSRTRLTRMNLQA